MGTRVRKWGRRILRWYLVHILIFGIAGPVLATAILAISPLSAHDTGLLFPLVLATALFLGLAVYFVRASLIERRKRKPA